MSREGLRQPPELEVVHRPVPPPLGHVKVKFGQWDGSVADLGDGTLKEIKPK